jgi:hypothetical protein
MGLGDLAGMLRGLQQAQAELERVKAALETAEVEGASGDGTVVARVNGRGELLAIKIDPRVVDRAAVAALESLVCEAARQATEKSRALVQQELAKTMSALGLPNVPGLMGLMGGS